MLSPSRLVALSFLAGLLAPVAAQRQWLSARALPPRSSGALAFDPVRDRLVLFGGYETDRPSDATWEWDGRSWQPRDPVNAPPPRFDAMMTYDAARRRVVLFGGVADGVELGDTWTWDGGNWTRIDGSPTPPARSAGSVAYDAGRERVVLFGGFAAGTRFGDTWEFDGTRWTERTPAHAPSARARGAMVHDSARGRVVLVGGQAIEGRFVSFLDDTWLWDGNDWTELAPPTRPRPMRVAAAAYDPTRDRVVLHGFTDGDRRLEYHEFDGNTWSLALSLPPYNQSVLPMLAWSGAADRVLILGTGRYTDLVAWDGTTPRTIAEPQSPPGGGGPLALDPLAQRVFAFPSDPVLGRTNWRWSDRRWQQVPSTTPLGLEGFDVATDPKRRRIVAFGRPDTPTTTPRETWEWDGVDWQLRSTPNQPTVRNAARLAYDPVHERVVLFGGLAFTSLSDTWTYDGSDWTALAVAGPSPRHGQAMATDFARGRIVMFGGEFIAVGRIDQLADAWEFDGNSWSRIASPPDPTVRGFARMAWDPIRQRVILAHTPERAGATRSTWEWDGRAWTRIDQSGAPRDTVIDMVFDPQFANIVALRVGSGTELLTGVAPAAGSAYGDGCGGALGAPTLGGDTPYLGNLGHTFELRDAPAATGCILALSSLPASTSLGNGCTLHVGGAPAIANAVTDDAGFARFALPLPADPTLLGLTAYGQAAALDATAPFGVSLTAGREIRIGY